MRLLLDTHVLLWWFFDDDRLSAKLRTQISNPDNEILVSSASAWEISTKHRLGKLPEAGEAVHRFRELVTQARMGELPVTVEHALLAGAFEVDHRDPFDRMLAAQSRAEGIPLATRDPAFSRFDIEVLW